MNRFNWVTPRVERATISLARRVLLARASGKPLPNALKEAHTDLLRHRGGVFVTVVNPAQVLRGCWGTVTSTRPDIAHELVQAADGAACRDTRFRPLRPQEVGNLTIYVSFIGPLEPGVISSRIDPLRQGILVRSGVREAVALPHEGKTVRRLIEVARVKARIKESERIEITPFQTHLIIGEPERTAKM